MHQIPAQLKGAEWDEEMGSQGGLEDKDENLEDAPIHNKMEFGQAPQQPFFATSYSEFEDYLSAGYPSHYVGSSDPDPPLAPEMPLSSAMVVVQQPEYAFNERDGSGFVESLFGMGSTQEQPAFQEVRRDVNLLPTEPEIHEVPDSSDSDSPVDYELKARRSSSRNKEKKQAESKRTSTSSRKSSDFTISYARKSGARKSTSRGQKYWDAVYEDGVGKVWKSNDP